MNIITIKTENYHQTFKNRYPDYIIGELYNLKHKTEEIYLKCIFGGYSRIDHGGSFFINIDDYRTHDFNLQDYFIDMITLISKSNLSDHLLTVFIHWYYVCNQRFG